jgi:hypothetical protein
LCKLGTEIGAEINLTGELIDQIPLDREKRDEKWKKNVNHWLASKLLQL